MFADDEITNIVDSVLTDNDEDNNGYIEYFEFKRKQDTQRSKASRQDQKHKQQQP